MRDRLLDLLEPSVAALGYELLDLDWQTGTTPATLRLYIDWPQGHANTVNGGTVNVDDCALVSDQVSAIMDVEDPISCEYHLEVSSPGIERPLRKPEHFVEFTGERAFVQLHTPNLEGRRRFTGAIVEVAGNELDIDVDGEIYTVTLSDVEKAHLKPDFNAWQKEAKQQAKKGLK